VPLRVTLVPRQLRNILKAKEGNSGATPQQRAFARERAPRELRVKTRRVVIQPGDESTWLTSSRVILGLAHFPIVGFHFVLPNLHERSENSP
jgi:hypothetical protein